MVTGYKYILVRPPGMAEVPGMQELYRFFGFSVYVPSVRILLVAILVRPPGMAEVPGMQEQYRFFGFSVYVPSVGILLVAIHGLPA